MSLSLGQSCPREAVTRFGVESGAGSVWIFGSTFYLFCAKLRLN